MTTNPHYLDAGVVARWFHETYERLAPEHGYETRPESAVPWEELPLENRTLMVDTAGEVLARIREAEGRYRAAIEADCRPPLWRYPSHITRQEASDG